MTCFFFFSPNFWPLDVGFCYFDLKFGFYVKYPYSLILRSKLDNAGQNTMNMCFLICLNICCNFRHFLKNIGFKNLRFWFFPAVLEVLGSSGRLIGTISSYGALTTLRTRSRLGSPQRTLTTLTVGAPTESPRFKHKKSNE